MLLVIALHDNLVK